jgi:S1-C subfamily serine protease
VPGSPAAQADLRPGMRIVAVGPVPVPTRDAFEEAVRRYDPDRACP